MLRRLVPFLLAALAAAPALAQGQRPRGFPALSVLQLPAPLQERMQLGDEQKQKLAAIQMKLREETRALLQGGGQAGQQVRQLRQKAEEEALALLTPEQKQQFDGLQAEVRQYEGLGRAAVALLLVKDLGDERKAKLRALSGEYVARRREIFQAAAPAGDRQAALQKIQALEGEAVAAIKTHLNEEQQKQFEQALSQLPRPGRRQRPGGGAPPPA